MAVSVEGFGLVLGARRMVSGDVKRVMGKAVWAGRDYQGQNLQLPGERMELSAEEELQAGAGWRDGSLGINSGLAVEVSEICQTHPNN